MEQEETRIIDKIKETSLKLWSEIQEAKKLNLDVYISFNDTLGRIRPEIKLSKVIFDQDSN